MKSIIHPYREPHPTGGSAAASLGEELIIYIALCVVGAMPVAGAISRGGAFGVEPTLGIFMMVAGIVGLLGALLAARRVPHDPDARWPCIRIDRR
jgi:hypothetical protein